jgi:hypothetical protein
MRQIMAKDDIIRFRCDGDLRARFARVAALMRREEADLARIIFTDFVAQEETKLGLAHYRISAELKDANSVAHLTDEIVADALARGGGPALKAPKPAPVSYRSTRKARHRSKVKPGAKPQ